MILARRGSTLVTETNRRPLRRARISPRHPRGAILLLCLQSDPAGFDVVESGGGEEWGIFAMWGV